MEQQQELFRNAFMFALKAMKAEKGLTVKVMSEQTGIKIPRINQHLDTLVNYYPNPEDEAAYLATYQFDLLRHWIMAGPSIVPAHPCNLEASLHINSSASGFIRRVSQAAEDLHICHNEVHDLKGSALIVGPEITRYGMALQ